MGVRIRRAVRGRSRRAWAEGGSCYRACASWDDWKGAVVGNCPCYSSGCSRYNAHSMVGTYLTQLIYIQYHLHFKLAHL